jgi:uncharacterized protein (DUF427 family)
MKAIWNNTVIAEADKNDLIRIEGNWYFPPNTLTMDYFKPSNHHTTCFWKGEASYYNVEAGGAVNENAAWYYPEPQQGSIERVKKDFTNYVAFWRGIEVVE